MSERGGRRCPCKKSAARTRVYTYTFHKLEGFISIQHCFAGTVIHFTSLSSRDLILVFIYLVTYSTTMVFTMAFNEILKRSISWSKVSTSVIILLSLSCFHSEIPFDFCYEKLIFRSGYIFSELLSLVRCVIRENYRWHWVTLSPLCDIFLYIIFLKILYE